MAKLPSANDANIAIAPKPVGVKLNQPINGRRIINQGEKTAGEAIPEIQKSLNSPVNLLKNLYIMTAWQNHKEQ